MKKILLLSLALSLLASTSSQATKPPPGNSPLRKPIYIDNLSSVDVQYAYQILGSFKWEGPYTISAGTDMQNIQPVIPLNNTPLYWEFWVAGTDCKAGKIMTITSLYSENFNLIDIITTNSHNLLINPINKDGGGPYGDPLNCTSK